MSNQFPVADMLTIIRNGLKARKSSVLVSASNFKSAILDVLTSEGYIQGHQRVELDGKPGIKVALKYDNQGKPVIHELTISSKPSRRVYQGVSEIPKVKNGFGVVVISTPKGVMSGRQAAAMKLGGEEVCTIF